MKKMLVTMFASVFAVTLMAAQEESISRVNESEGRMLDVVETEKVTNDEAWWPAFFAISEWPSTPDLIGLRITIPFSTRQECVTGIDIGFWGACKDFEGIQVNVLRNDVRDTFGGVQLGLYNSVSRGDLFGFQIGLWNQANSFRGVQAGLVNVTGDAQGFQLGVINRAETLYGFQVGLINVIRDAEIPVLPFVNIGF